MVGYVSGILAALIVAAAADEQKAPPKQANEAVFSFSGKKGKPLKIVDHTAGDKVTTHEDYEFANQSTEGSIAAARERRVVTQPSAPDTDTAAAAAQAPAPTEAEAPAANGQPELTVEEGLELLRQQNWMTFSTGGGPTPSVVFNPQTKQFVPTEQAIKSLGNPQPSYPVVTGKRTSTPPTPRASDPTP